VLPCQRNPCWVLALRTGRAAAACTPGQGGRHSLLQVRGPRQHTPAPACPEAPTDDALCTRRHWRRTQQLEGERATQPHWRQGVSFCWPPRCLRPRGVATSWREVGAGGARARSGISRTAPSLLYCIVCLRVPTGVCATACPRPVQRPAMCVVTCARLRVLTGVSAPACPWQGHAKAGNTQEQQEQEMAAALALEEWSQRLGVKVSVPSLVLLRGPGTKPQVRV